MPDVIYEPLRRARNIKPLSSDGGEIFSFGDLGKGVVSGAEGFGRSIVGLADTVTGGDLIPDSWSEDRYFDRPETLVGGFAESLTQFGLGFFTSGLGWAGRAGKVVSAFQKARTVAGEANLAAKAAGVAFATARGSIADFVAFDGHDGRLSNLLESFPELQNPVTEYLQADENDSELEGRLKNVIEGRLADVGMFGIAKVFGLALKGYKRGLKAAKRGLDEGLQLEDAAELARREAYSPELQEELAAAQFDGVPDTVGSTLQSVTANAPSLVTAQAKLDPKVWGTDADLKAKADDVPLVGQLRLETISRKAARDASTRDVKGGVAEGLFTAAEGGKYLEDALKAVGPEIAPANVPIIRNFVASVGKRLLGDVDLKFAKGLPGTNDVTGLTPAGRIHFPSQTITLADSAIETGELSTTLLHELWHSLERYLGVEEVVDFRRQFSADREAFIASGGPGAEQLAKNQPLDPRAFDHLDEASRRIAFDRAYGFTNESEYFAVNMTGKTLAQLKDNKLLSFGRSWFVALGEAFAEKFGSKASNEIFNSFIKGERTKYRVVSNRPLVNRADVGLNAMKPKVTEPALKKLDEAQAKVRKAVKDVQGSTEGDLKASEILRDPYAVQEVVGQYEPFIRASNLSLADGEVEFLRAAEHIANRQTAGTIKETRGRMDSAKAVAEDTVGVLTEVMGSKAMPKSTLEAVIELASKAGEAGLKAFHLLGLSRAALTKFSRDVAASVVELKPKLAAGSQSDLEVAALLRQVEKFGDLAVNIRNAVFTTGKSLRKLKDAPSGGAFKALKALEEGKIPSAATEAPATAAKPTEIATEAPKAPEAVPAAEAPVAAPKAATGELPFTDEAVRPEAPSVTNGQPATAPAPEAPAPAKDYEIVKTPEPTTPADKAVARQQGRIDKLIGELGLTDEQAKAIIERFGGRKSALKFLNGLSAFADDPEVMAKIFSGTNEGTRQAWMQAGGDLTKFAKAIREEAGERGWKDKFMEWYMNSLLSGPKTIATNAFGGVIPAVWRPLELAIGGLGRAVTRGDLRSLSEPLMYMTQMVADAGDAWRIAKRAFKAEEPQLLGDVAGVLEGSRAKAISARGFGVADASAAGKTWNTIGRFVRLPATTLTASDEFWKQLAFRSEARIQAFRKGLQEGMSAKDAKTYADTVLPNLTSKDGVARTRNAMLAEARENVAKDPANAGLDEDALAELAKDEADRLIQVNKDAGFEDITEEARKWAEEATFTRALGNGNMVDNAGRKIQDFMADYPLMRVLLPFVRTPINILKFSYDRMDLPGVLGLALKKTAKLKETNVLYTRLVEDIAKGGYHAQDATARLAFGMSTSVLIATMAANGTITGTGPQNRAQRNALEATGWQPLSFKVGDTYVSYARMDPAATTLGVIADFYEASKAAPSSETSLLTSTFAGIVASVTQNMTRKSYLVGMSEALEMVQNPLQRAPRMLARTVAPIVAPTFFSQTTTATDPWMREIQGVIGEIRSRYGDRDIEVRRDALGAPIKRRKSLGGEEFSPLNAVLPIDAREASNDPVRNEMARLQHGFTPAKDSYAGIDLRGIKAGEDSSAYNRWMELHQEVKIDGRGIEAALQRLIGSDRYKRMADDADGSAGLESPKVAAINAVIGKYRRKAFNALAKESPDVASEYARVQRARMKR